MGAAEIQEASATTQIVVGFSAYLHAIGYPLDQFKAELAAAIEYIKSQNP